jgi:hypothetical protein
MSSPSPILTATQEHVLAQIANGATQTAAAESDGVHRNTIRNWLASPAFRKAFASAQHQNRLFWHDQAAAIGPAAMEQLTALVTEPGTPDGVRLKAILAVMARLANPPEWIEPLPETPRAMHNFAQAPLNLKDLSPNPAAPVHSPAQAETDPAGEEPPSLSTFRREGPKLGRNDLCPCGSGKKFKRCCLGKTSSPIASLSAA